MANREWGNILNFFLTSQFKSALTERETPADILGKKKVNAVYTVTCARDEKFNAYGYDLDLKETNKGGKRFSVRAVVAGLDPRAGRTVRVVNSHEDDLQAAKDIGAGLCLRDCTETRCVFKDLGKFEYKVTGTPPKKKL